MCTLTWISVNEHTLTLCLLSHHEVKSNPLEYGWLSRGLLVEQLTAEQTAATELHRNCHRQHLLSKAPYSVCMHRPNAQTVRHSHIRMSPSGIDFNYFDGYPCNAEMTNIQLRFAQEEPQPVVNELQEALV